MHTPKPRLLILVHMEETYRDLFRRNMIPNLVHHIKTTDYARVIHLHSGCPNFSAVEELDGLVEEIYWTWGYEDDMGLEEDYLITSLGHAYTYIEPKLRNIRYSDYSVFIGGGCHGECLADLETILMHYKVPYTRLHRYIYSVPDRYTILPDPTLIYD